MRDHPHALSGPLLIAAVYSLITALPTTTAEYPISDAVATASGPSSAIAVTANVWSSAITSGAPLVERQVIFDVNGFSFDINQCEVNPELFSLSSVLASSNFMARSAELVPFNSVSCPNSSRMIITIRHDPYYVVNNGGDVIIVSFFATAFVGALTQGFPYDPATHTFWFRVQQSQLVIETGVNNQVLLAAYGVSAVSTISAAIVTAHPLLVTVMPRAQFLYAVSLCSFAEMYSVDVVQYPMQISFPGFPWGQFEAVGTMNAVFVAMVFVAGYGVSFALRFASERRKVISLLAAKRETRDQKTSRGREGHVAGASIRPGINSQEEANEATRQEKKNLPRTSGGRGFTLLRSLRHHIGHPAPQQRDATARQSTRRTVNSVAFARAWRHRPARDPIFVVIATLVVLFFKSSLNASGVVWWQVADLSTRIAMSFVMFVWFFGPIGTALYAVRLLHGAADVRWCAEDTRIQSCFDAFTIGDGYWLLVQDVAHRRDTDVARVEKRGAIFLPLIEAYRPERTWFIAVEIVYSAALGILESTRTDRGCQYIAAPAAAAGLLYWICLVLAKPHAAPLDRYWYLMTASVFTVAPLSQTVYFVSYVSILNIFASFLLVFILFASVARLVTAAVQLHDYILYRYVHSLPWWLLCRLGKWTLGVAPYALVKEKIKKVTPGSITEGHKEVTHVTLPPTAAATETARPVNPLSHLNLSKRVESRTSAADDEL